MKVKDIVKALDAEILVGDMESDVEINTVCGSDLMSDVMAYIKDKALLLTGLVNPQVIRTAEMMDIKVVVFVRGKVPPQNVLDLARDRDIIILTTKHPMFIACGKLYSAGIRGKE